MIKVELPLSAIVCAVCYWIGGMPLLLVCIGARVAWSAWNSSGTNHVPAQSSADAPQTATAPLWNSSIQYDRDGTAINSTGPKREPRVRGDLFRLWGTGALVSAVLFAIGWMLHLGG